MVPGGHLCREITPQMLRLREVEGKWKQHHENGVLGGPLKRIVMILRESSNASISPFDSPSQEVLFK